MSISDPFLKPTKRPHREDGSYSEDETRLANRNHGLLLETMRRDVTPTGAHYLLNHFDIPMLDDDAHVLRFHGAFENPFTLNMGEIRAMPEVTMPVTLECAGNGRAGLMPRSCSMPWAYEAAGTSEWTGTMLAPLLERAGLRRDAVEVSFTGADFGFDRGDAHHFGRALTLQQLQDLDVMLVHSMNGIPLLPQHGAPLRIIVPGWYGMASVKWLTDIEALTTPYTGFQQVETYQFREDHDDPGRPVTSMRVKSLMVAPGVPDWLTRRRFVEAGAVEVMGRAWSGRGVPIERVEFACGDQWQAAELGPVQGKYAWRKWSTVWTATPGEHILRCRAWDADGNVQPLEQVWDVSGFANNLVQEVQAYVPKLG